MKAWSIILILFTSVAPATASASERSARAYLNQGLPHPAFLEFQATLEDANSSFGMKLRSVESLQQLLNDHAYFVLSAKSVNAAVALSYPRQPILQKFYQTLLMRHQLDPDLYPQDYAHLAVETATISFISALNRVRLENSPDTLANLWSQLSRMNSNAIPTEIKKRFSVDLEDAELAITRGYLKLKDYETVSQRIGYQVKKYPSSPEFMALNAWNEFVFKKYPESMQKALFLRTPVFKNYFSPKTALLPAMIYLKNCDYVLSQNYLSVFQENYKHEAAYLGGPRENDYMNFIASLKNTNKPRVPAKILATWLKDTTLVNLFDENNLILDEESALASSKKTPAQIVIERDLKNLEKANLAAIQKKLFVLATEMKTQLDDAVGTANQLMEDALVGKKPKSENRILASTRTPKPKSAWSWERKDIRRIENEEVWADELANLSPDVKNKCGQ